MRERLELIPRARLEGQVDAVRELLEREPAVDGVLAQCGDGVVALGVRGAESRCLVVQSSRSLG